MIIAFMLLCVGSFSALLPFNPERLRLVDTHNLSQQFRSFLFRSGSPLTTNLKSFNSTGLFNVMREEAKLNNLKFPLTTNDFYFIDISLLSETKSHDKIVLNAEKAYFALKTTGGLFLNYPIFGNKHSPMHVTNITKREEYAKTYDERSKDKLPTLVEFIRTLLTSTFKKPLILLVHCMEGVDRSGEVIGAYLMRYKNFTLPKVIAQDTLINDGTPAPKTANYYSLEWYQLYLKMVKDSS